MTADQRAAARFLLTVYQSAQAHADTLDPQRTKADRAAVALDDITTRAREGFLALTGRHVFQVSMHELSPEHPADWAKG